MLTVRASVESNIAANVRLVISAEKEYDGIICQNTELGILKFAVYSIRIAMKDAIDKITFTDPEDKNSMKLALRSPTMQNTPTTIAAISAKKRKSINITFEGVIT